MNNTLEDYLRQMVSIRRGAGLSSCEMNYSCGEELVLREGRAFSSILPSPQSRPLGQCFYNAQKIALGWDLEWPDRRRRLIYIEGYAMDVKLGVPMAHGWLSDREGSVYDPTWSDCEAQYYGIPFKRRYIERKARDGFGPLIDDWENRWPLLTGRDNINVAKEII